MIELGIDDGIATIIWNIDDRPMNVLNDASISAFETAVRKVIADPRSRASSSRPLGRNSSSAPISTRCAASAIPRLP